MAQESTAEEVKLLAAKARLDLPDAYQDQLLSAWRHLEQMTGRIHAPRPRADEPAHVFVPATFGRGG